MYIYYVCIKIYNRKVNLLCMTIWKVDFSLLKEIDQADKCIFTFHIYMRDWEYIYTLQLQLQQQQQRRRYILIENTKIEQFGKFAE